MSTEMYSDTEMKEFEKILSERMEQERALLADLHQQREEHGSREQAHNDSYGDDAKADQILSRLSALVEHKENYLQKLEYSLARVKNGTYGIDQNTGQKIDKARLLAEPTAMHNI